MVLNWNFPDESNQNHELAKSSRNTEQMPIIQICILLFIHLICVDGQNIIYKKLTHYGVLSFSVIYKTRWNWEEADRILQKKEGRLEVSTSMILDGLETKDWLRKTNSAPVPFLVNLVKANPDAIAKNNSKYQGLWKAWEELKLDVPKKIYCAIIENHPKPQEPCCRLILIEALTPLRANIEDDIMNHFINIVAFHFSPIEVGFVVSKKNQIHLFYLYLKLFCSFKSLMSSTYWLTVALQNNLSETLLLIMITIYDGSFLRVHYWIPDFYKYFDDYGDVDRMYAASI